MPTIPQGPRRHYPNRKSKQHSPQTPGPEVETFLNLKCLLQYILSNGYYIEIFFPLPATSEGGCGLMNAKGEKRDPMQQTYDAIASDWKSQSTRLHTSAYFALLQEINNHRDLMTTPDQCCHYCYYKCYNCCYARHRLVVERSGHSGSSSFVQKDHEEWRGLQSSGYLKNKQKGRKVFEVVPFI